MRQRARYMSDSFTTNDRRIRLAGSIVRPHVTGERDRRGAILQYAAGRRVRVCLGPFSRTDIMDSPIRTDKRKCFTTRRRPSLRLKSERAGSSRLLGNPARSCF